MRVYSCFLIVLFSVSSLAAQCYNRYWEDVFIFTSQTSDLVYGSNTNASGDTVQLLLDVYQPDNDPLVERPLIVLLHGGNFAEGSKNDPQIVDFSNRLARRGFVVGSINYRQPSSLYHMLDADSVFAHTLRAAQDAKAAVRFFRQEASMGNTYGIDTNAIFFAGIGSGSVAAQMAVYLNDTSEIQPDLRSLASSLGGLEGQSGNAGFSSEVKALINFSGATLDTAWMSDNNTPIVSVHGVLDDYYPYGLDSLFRYTLNDVCNGHHELCYRRFNEVSTVMTHNGQAYLPVFSPLAANQGDNIAAQLNFGLRGIGMKLYQTNNIFCGGNGLYGYHGDPFLGCESFNDIGGYILNFLQNNPNEVIAITIEGGASVTEVAAGFGSVGLTPYLYEHTFGEPWPTLKELIDNGDRLVVFHDDAGTAVPGFHEMWPGMWDTDYNHQDPATFDCEKDRGNHNADLFLLNHFITVATPQILWAQTINEWDYLLDRARGCWDHNNQMPNFLFLDFFSEGDVIRAVDSVNRIGDDFRAVYGSFLVDSMANEYGIASSLLTLNQGYAPFLNTSTLADSALDFTGRFLTDQFPCLFSSCAPPSVAVTGDSTPYTNSSQNYTIDFHEGSTYKWIVQGGQVLDTTDNLCQVQWSALGGGQIQVIETTQYGCVYDTLTLAIQVVTSVDKITNKPQIQLFPNPSRNYTQLIIPNSDQSAEFNIQFFDQQGRLVRELQTNRHLVLIRLEELASGMYNLRVQGSQTYWARLVRE